MLVNCQTSCGVVNGSDNDIEEEDDDEDGNENQNSGRDGGSPTRLKMYGWENHDRDDDGHRGYWCAACDGTCRNGKRLEIEGCDNRSPEWQFVNLQGGTRTQIQLRGTDLCWEMGSLEDIFLVDCDSSNDCQHFGSGQGNL